MNPSRVPIRAHVLLAVCAALAAGAIAAVVVRVPEVWPLLPGATTVLAVKVFGANSQEQVADAEFLGVWLVAFPVALALAYLALVLVRSRQ
jgi:hypothetical protein